jgi:hypothetical protein
MDEDRTTLGDALNYESQLYIIGLAYDSLPDHHDAVGVLERLEQTLRPPQVEVLHPMIELRVPFFIRDRNRNQPILWPGPFAIAMKSRKKPIEQMLRWRVQLELVEDERDFF